MNCIDEFISKRFSNESICDYTKKEDLQPLLEELHRFPLNGTYHSQIVGKETKGSATVVSVNPNKPSQVIGTFTMLDPDAIDVDSLLETMHAASKTFSALPLLKRVEVLRQVATVLRERRLHAVATLILEAGNTPFEADADVAEAIDFADYYAATAELLFSTNITGNEPLKELQYRPWGTILSIDPFNFPIAIALGQATLALAGGNAVISKPSQYTPYCGKVVYDCLIEAMKRSDISIPGLVNVMYANRDVAKKLLHHPKLNGFCFTGSLESGRHVFRDALNDNPFVPGKSFMRLQPLSFETNGVNAAIILDDANLDVAVSSSVAAMVGFSGQKCSARSWSIVQEGIYDTFKTKFVDALTKLTIGPVVPTESGYSAMGAVVSLSALEKAEQQIQECVAKGAKIIVGTGKREHHPDGGYLLKPVLMEVDMETLRKHPELRSIEVFAPVSCIIKVRDYEEAFAVEQIGNYALTGTIYTKDQAIIQRWIQESRVGNKYVNRKETGARVGQTFGGGGDSDSGLGGIKGAGSPFTVLRAVNMKAVVGYSH